MLTLTSSALLASNLKILKAIILNLPQLLEIEEFDTCFQNIFEVATVVLQPSSTHARNLCV